MTDPLYAGASVTEDAYIVAMAAQEGTGVLATGLGDGRVTLRLLQKPETLLLTVEAHKDGLSALITSDDGFLSAGEDGKILRISAKGEVTPLAHIEKARLELLAQHAETGMVAVAYKKTVALIDTEGKIRAQFSDHPSGVQGLCFDMKGKRLAASHYGGISLYWVNGEAAQKPQRVNWKGSHLALGWSPNGKYLVSAMQESTLHGWRLPDFTDFQMSGYAQKPKSFSWSMDSRWIATGGSPGIICWDCGGKGPMGKPPQILGEACQEISTHVACHPELPLVAAATAGGLAYLARFEDKRIVWLKTAGSEHFTHHSWSASGMALIAGTENGRTYVWEFVE